MNLRIEKRKKGRKKGTKIRGAANWALEASIGREMREAPEAMDNTW
jgi:hypothetical protein